MTVLFLTTSVAYRSGVAAGSWGSEGSEMGCRAVCRNVSVSLRTGQPPSDSDRRQVRSTAEGSDRRRGRTVARRSDRDNIKTESIKIIV